MTAVEKAKELYFKYYQQVADGSFPEYNAKQCALIAVDEIIEQHEGSVDFLWSEIGYLMAPPVFWEEVKKEINNL